jgi:hypothetical protein
LAKGLVSHVGLVTLREILTPDAYLSVQHSDEDVDRYVEVFTGFCQELVRVGGKFRTHRQIRMVPGGTI